MNERIKKHELLNKSFNLFDYIDERYGLMPTVSNDLNGLSQVAATCPFCGKEDFYLYDRDYNYNGFEAWHSDCLINYLEHHSDLKDKINLKDNKKFYTEIGRASCRERVYGLV